MKKSTTAVATGIILGILGARYVFVGSWLNLIPWSLAGLGLGYWGTKDEALINGTSYGFILSFVFMLAGYSGKASWISRVPFFVVLAVFGGICGLFLGWFGYLAKIKLKKPTRAE